MEMKMTDCEKDQRKKPEGGYFKRLWNSFTTAADSIKFWIELAALLVVCLYTHYASQQANAALAANRPYVGFSGMSYSYVDKERKPDGTYILTERPTNTSDSLIFQAKIKNFGPLPGLTFSDDWKITFGGKVPPNSPRIGPGIFTLYPTQEVALPGIVGPADFPDLMNGNKQLVIEITVQYDGPSGHYTDCNKEQFAPTVNGFFNVGGCTN
jgi:hypothetical protein